MRGFGMQLDDLALSDSSISYIHEISFKVFPSFSRSCIESLK